MKRGMKFLWHTTRITGRGRITHSKPQLPHHHVKLVRYISHYRSHRCGAWFWWYCRNRRGHREDFILRFYRAVHPFADLRPQAERLIGGLDVAVNQPFLQPD